MMTKSEKISEQFQLAQSHIDLAESILQNIREIPSNDAERLNRKFIEMSCLIEDFTYEICMPLEMREEETAQEIEALEKRLAELRAQ
jgi:hypothetical protein